MSATVVVPTRDRPDALRRCLAAVRSGSPQALDVVVVDDGSRAAAAVAAVAAAAGARLVRLGGAGPSAARNAGVEAAAEDVILMLDDDCVPAPGWASALVAAVEPGCAVAGAVVPPAGASAWLRASERIAAEAEAGAGFYRTLNLACRKELLLRLPFDQGFPAAAGEDRDWCFRAARAGVRFVRVPGAVVEHGAELDLPGFARQQLRYGAAVHLLRRRGTHLPVPARALGRGLAAALRDDVPVGAAMGAALFLTGLGYVSEAVGRSG